ncbi:hypothetical protein Tco_0726552 [Tanacetum coccineum]|uniref:Uncharacterized protein n=1 Tax=Tanacetum coccineum TaxID=301880 RepID=A0ABQ4YGU6_9ASTR
MFSPKYLSLASIKELNKNPSAPNRVHFVILNTNDDTEEEDTSSTNTHEHKLDDMVRRSEEVREQDKEEDEMETDIEIEEVIEEEESEFKTDEEVEEIFEEEEEDEDNENFNSFLTMKELSYHEWLLKNPRPPWIMTYRLRSRQKLSKPDKICNFVGRVRCLKVFIGSFTYECDFMILEDTSSTIDFHLGEMVFGRPFIDENGLVYNKEEGTVMFEQDDEKITFKMPHTMEIFKLYFMRRSLEVLRKFHWMILEGRFNQLSHCEAMKEQHWGEYCHRNCMKLSERMRQIDAAIGALHHTGSRKKIVRVVAYLREIQNGDLEKLD